MFFHTFQYLVFFLLVFTVYWSLPWNRVRVWLLVGSSFYFYWQWSEELALLVTTTTVLDYLFGRAMGHFQRSGVRRLFLITSIVMNLGILCYFKYRGFFLNELYDALSAFGYHPGFSKLNPLDIIIPFGISFYTFEAISYAVDVYRRKIPPEKDLSHFMLFILFFPHLVAGPIVRAGDFLPQVKKRKHWNWMRMELGVKYFLMGLFKKVAIADRMALYCDPVFENPGAYSTESIWLAVLAFSIRIYCDFSGYSDMAVGCAHMLGYRLTLNFNMPYLSKNVSEFWRRWHISLSTWLRDYLFIPLGGSRGGRWLICRNLMITMLLGGLWHGADWSFLVWGALHGALLVGHRLFKEFADGQPRLSKALESIPGSIFRMALTFFCVSMCWVFFQPSWQVSVTMLERMFVTQDGLGLALSPRSLWYTVGFMMLCHYLGSTGIWQKIALRTPAPILGFGYAMALTLALVLMPDNGHSFIYFQF